jgi:hypothetical protein
LALKNIARSVIEKEGFPGEIVGGGLGRLNDFERNKVKNGFEGVAFFRFIN